MNMKRSAGFTLVELLVVVAVIGAILVLAGPSFRDMILMQRLRGINAQLVTDMQFARAEAVARRDFVRVSFRFNTEMTCYTLYTSTTNNTRCDCRLGPVNACASSANMKEIKTVQFPKSEGVEVKPTSAMGSPAISFDWRTGGLLDNPLDFPPQPRPEYVVGTVIDATRALNTRLNTAGRPTVCSPSGSIVNEPACP